MRKLIYFVLAVLMIVGFYQIVNAGYTNPPFATATNVDIGTTTITGGTTGYLLYNNGGILGQIAANTAVPTGFTRVSPNHVISSSNQAFSAIVINSTCTTLNLANLGITSTAKSVTLHMEIALSAGTAAGVQQSAVVFYRDSGCTTVLGGMGANNAEGHQFRSFAGAAVPNGQEFAMNESHVEVFNNGATTIYAKRIDTIVSGGSATAHLDEVISYND